MVQELLQARNGKDEVRPTTGHEVVGAQRHSLSALPPGGKSRAHRNSIPGLSSLLLDANTNLHKITMPSFFYLRKKSGLKTDSGYKKDTIHLHPLKLPCPTPSVKAVTSI